MAYQVKLMWRGSSLARGCVRRASSSPAPLAFSAEVLRARAEGKPIVALESTIITHGMPYPHNLQTAQQVENIIRERGATPATIAILQGQLTVGLSADQLAYLAQADGVVKASRRDLAPVAAAKLDGATTVAGTIVAAELADIPVFVTGGIGGVHREGENTLDISADLTELGRSRTLVVCSGVKSILDIGRTLEYLETQGVCVCAYGRSDEFPAFYTRRSGHRAPHRAPDAVSAARILHCARALQLASGIVVAVPLPEEYAMDELLIENAIKLALEEADKKGIRGKEVTPFILAAVAKATGGASLDANIALIKNNAKVGADIAVQFEKLKNVDDAGNPFNIGASKGRGRGPGSRALHTSSRHGAGGSEDRSASVGKNLDGDVLVIGGANVDRTYRVTEPRVALDGSTHACVTHQCAGGVGRNMAEALWRLRGRRVRLLTAVGDDADGRYLDSITPGMLLDGCVVSGARTAAYAAVLDARGGCQLGLGDMEVHNQITPELVDKHKEVLKRAPLVVLDGNPPQHTVDYVLELCRLHQIPVFFEPTDRRKSVKPLHKRHNLAYASPNIAELRAMVKCVKPDAIVEDSNDISEILKLSKIICQFIDNLIITLGPKGAIIITKVSGNTNTDITARLYHTKSLDFVESVSGAGDCFSSGFIHGILSGYSKSQCMSVAFDVAKCALLSSNNVPPNFVIQYNKTKSKYEDLL